ncbi:MAG: diaminopropionate ammonia-lyase [Pseudomonadota bacterium]
MQCLENAIDRHAWANAAVEKFRAMAHLDDLRAYLDLCPAYKHTPLSGAPALAADLNIGRLLIKDETDRMGLGSFKALGGAYAIFDMLLSRAEHTHGAPVTVNANMIETLKSVGKDMVFCCASAGNHGLSVLAGANLFGAQAVIYLCESVPDDFAKRLTAKGAEVRREGADYDASMDAAHAACDAHGWALVSDSSWAGYEEFPLAIMKGYAAMTDEVAAQYSETGQWPTHVFLQAGVGGLAGGLANHIRLAWPQQPSIIIVEPEKAACLLESIRAGAITQVDAPGTNMGRLDCAEASMLAFEILRNTADAFITISDEEAERAVDTLKAVELATTPSGGAGYAGLVALSQDGDLRRRFGIDENAHCLCFVTECALGKPNSN